MNRGYLLHAHLNKPKRSVAAPFGQLAAQIHGEVHTDELRRFQLATDASIFQKMPAAVVYPRCREDVQATVRFAVAHGYHLHPRGAGSGLCGSALGDGIVVDFSKHMNRLLRLAPDEGFFECEPGYRFGELAEALAGSGLFFPPDPSSGEYATFGGMCATNASGAHSVKYGNTADYLLDAEVVLTDGTADRLSALSATPLAQLPPHIGQLARLYLQHRQVIEAAYPDIACNVAGYNLRGLVHQDRLYLHRLLCGSEGTLGLTTRLRLRLLARPAAESLVVAYFEDIIKAARAVQYAMTLAPAGIEIMDKSLLTLARAESPALGDKIPSDVDNVLLIEFDGPSAAACTAPAETTRRHLLDAELARQADVAVSSEEKAAFWALRKAAVPTLYKLKGRRKVLALVEDAAVPVGRLVPYFEGIYALFHRLKVDFVLYGHIAKGLMHTRPLLDLKDPGDVDLLQPIADAVFDLVNGLGGTVSGEHGDGRLRSAYVARKYPEIFELFQRTKQLMDPHSILNPEIKVQGDPEQMARDLRFGRRYRSVPPANLRLKWRGGFIEEVEKCHGCSKCTTVTTATRMCPVYKVTRDEDAAPKAKANVLRALISGHVNRQALYAAELQQVMACCINCGSCYKECPSNVNIAQMAMEAKTLYARRYGTRLPDRITGEVEKAARMTHRLAPLIDPVMRRPAIYRLAARLTGLAPQREMVTFSRRSLYEQMPAHRPGRGPRVLYFAGCYAGYIRPALGRAALDVLSRMGFDVYLPPQSCCGLPQLSKGMRTSAARAVQRNLSAWRQLVSRVDAITVTCSSCGHALMQDWSCLLPAPAAGQIQEKTMHISHLLNQHRDRMVLTPTSLCLAYHYPCHLKLQHHGDSSMRLLNTLPGVHMQDLASHCCGIAGSWGMLAANYELSKQIGTPMIQRLEASPAPMGITDCPTCEMQMSHLSSKPVLHPIEIVWAGMEQMDER
ncbi:MAG: FAD-binding protein [Desulfatitalea sp.]|nr:FAD-binding protein [Desulfatitalea sp.]NNJ99907.1 FAD-binding protein [Desulfatitalea sp.]